MWIAHGKPGGPQPAIIAKPYTLRDARDRLAEVSGDRAFANEFFDKYIEGRDVPDYARLFARAGLILRKRRPGGPWVGLLDQGAGGFGGRRGRRGAAPASDPGAAGAVRIPTLVEWGSPAFDAGLEQDDAITTADGKPIASVQEWQAAITAHKPGDRMVVGYTRRDGLAGQATMTVGEDPTLEVVTVEASGGTLTAEQKAFRDAWLGPKRK
jgi:predicted metalloprotease with PDZ domain